MLSFYIIKIFYLDNWLLFYRGLNYSQMGIPGVRESGDMASLIKSLLGYVGKPIY